MWRIGNAPTSWGIEKPSSPDYPSWQQVLDDISEAGYQGVDLGPYGFFPTHPEILKDELEKRGLELSGCTVMTPLDERDRRAEIIALGKKAAQLTGALNGKYLVIIDGFGTERENTAGRSKDAARLDNPRWKLLIEMTKRLAEVAQEEGLRCVFHPHAGTRVEFEDEIERLLADTSKEDLGICFDTGHLAFAGMDPVRIIRAYSQYLDYVHLKDISIPVLQSVVDQKLGFWDAYRREVFCPLGEGSVDFDAIRDVLTEVKYSGWLTVEQDTSPIGDVVPLYGAISSMKYLVQHGIAER